VSASLTPLVSARPIINSVDRAELVAGYALTFKLALVVGSWSYSTARHAGRVRTIQWVGLCTGFELLPGGPLLVNFL